MLLYITVWVGNPRSKSGSGNREPLSFQVSKGLPSIIASLSGKGAALVLQCTAFTHLG